jgi:hypothetical protein
VYYHYCTVAPWHPPSLGWGPLGNLSRSRSRSALCVHRARRCCDANAPIFMPIRAELAEHGTENCTRMQRHEHTVEGPTRVNRTRRTRIRCQIDAISTSSLPFSSLTALPDAWLHCVAPPRSTTTTCSQRSSGASGRADTLSDLLLSTATHLRRCYSPSRLARLATPSLCGFSTALRHTRATSNGRQSCALLQALVPAASLRCFSTPLHVRKEIDSTFPLFFSLDQ